MTKEKLRQELEYNLYQEMCSSCPNAKRCHEDCEECEDYMKRKEQLFKQYHCEEETMTIEEWEIYFKTHYTCIKKGELK